KDVVMDASVDTVLALADVAQDVRKDTVLAQCPQEAAVMSIRLTGASPIDELGSEVQIDSQDQQLRPAFELRCEILAAAGNVAFLVALVIVQLVLVGLAALLQPDRRRKL